MTDAKQTPDQLRGPARDSSGPWRFELGAQVRCADGSCGELRRVVLDPVPRVVTHLVVEPRHRTGAGRLVPVDMVQATSPGDAEALIQLTSTLEEFDRLPFAEQILAPGVPDDDLEGEQLMTVPFYGLDPGSTEFVQEFGGNATQPYVADAPPAGEVEVLPHEQVRATDGTIGRISGVAVARGSHQITHLLVHEGHLWEKREISVPIGNVVNLDSRIELNIAKAEIAGLPALRPH